MEALGNRTDSGLIQCTASIRTKLHLADVLSQFLNLKCQIHPDSSTATV